MKETKLKKNEAAKAYAVILAGGNGERFWPLSTKQRPKPFVDIFEGKALIRHAFDRLDGLIPPERTFVITASRLVSLTHRTLPELPVSNIIAEPCPRNTAAAVAVACGLVTKLAGGDAVACIFAADQIMSPAKEFRSTLSDSIKVASKHDSIVTIGIKPEFAATEFGYIECGTAVQTRTKTEFNNAKRFVEKPNEPTAKRYVKSGKFRWNAGMFVWRASVMQKAFAAAAPEFLPLVSAIASSKSPLRQIRRFYPDLRSISVDFAVMEKITNILVAKSSFHWDDVGTWQALANHFPLDQYKNVRTGKTAVLNSSSSIIISSDDHLTAVLGMSDVVVVHTPNATLVCPRNKAHEIRDLVKNL